MSYPPGTSNGLKDVSLSIAGTRRRLCTASSCIPCPTCTSFLTNHRGLKLVTFVDPTEARCSHLKGIDGTDDKNRRNRQATCPRSTSPRK